ncbi:uncharacterized protein prr33 isoform 2-T2 [Menidia menidia]
MALAYGTAAQIGLLPQQYPPPLLPKPGKDNVRLQKLLKRSAKKKASTQASQPTTLFRSSLSPVNEASADLEHSDHSTPTRTPDTLPSLYGVQPPPRFTVRPLYQHVASPYPQRAAYGTRDSLRPASAVATSHSKPTSPGPTSYPSQPVIRPLTVLTLIGKSKSPRPTFKATEPSKSPKPMFDVPKIRMYTASTSYYETSRTPPVYDSAGLTAIGSTVAQSKTSAETKQDWSPAFEVIKGTATATQTLSLDTDAQRKTPTTESKTAAPKSEIKRATPTSETRRATPTSETRRATPTSETRRATPTSETRRATPTSETRRATPTAEIKTTTPTSEIKTSTPTTEIQRATPKSEIRRATPTSEMRRATPTSEIKRATPTSEMRRATPTSEIKRATPTSEIRIATPIAETKRSTSQDRAKTPTYEFQTSRTFAGRAKTPAYHLTRAATPVFEVSRANPLLFAVPPITVETGRSKTPLTISAESSSSAQSAKMTEPPEILLNGDIHPDITPETKPVQQIKTKLKSDPDPKGAVILTAEAGSQRPKTQTPVLSTPAVTSYQRPTTPTFVASRLMTISPGYKRPKTPTYGTSPSSTSHVTGQRPKSPVSQKSKSGYRGLTPAEYAAYGGIKTYSPAFGMSSSMMPTQEGVKAEKELLEERSQQPSEQAQSTVEVSKGKETPQHPDELKGLDKPAYVPSIPIIVVSQASESSGSILTQEMSTVSVSKTTVTKERSKASAVEGELSEKQPVKTQLQETKYKTNSENQVVKTAIQETKLKTNSEKQVVKIAIQETKLMTNSEKQVVKTAIQETKLKTNSTEIKRGLPTDSDQDPMKAVKKLFGKEKVQTTEKKAINEIKAVALKQKEPLTPASVTTVKSEVSKPGPEAPVVPAKALAVEPETTDKDKSIKAETSSVDKSALSSDRKEANESLHAAESPLKVLQKAKGLKSKLSGWSRLKKHMVVEQEEPQFPEVGSQSEISGQDQREAKTEQEKPGDTPGDQDDSQAKDSPRATKMWDAMLFQMFSSKENIMHQIQLNQSEEKKDENKDELKEIPSFAYRLPVLLFSPRFDAKKLREAASRPVTKISTVFEMGLIGRKGKEEEPKDFNRTARGFTAP